MKDGNSEAIEGLIGVIDGRGIDYKYHDSANCPGCADARTVTAGIEAIREMQAKSAGREDEYLDVYVQVSAENDRLKEELHIARNSCNFGQGKRIMAGCDKALTEVDHLKEELRIAENSWNFEEGKRIIAQRDKALAEVERLRADGCGVDCNTSLAERNDLRAKLRTTEEARGVAEAEVERLREERDALLKQRHDATESIRQAGNLASQAVWELSDIQGKPLSQACPECGAMECRHRSTESADETADKAEEAAENARLFLGRTAEVWHEEVVRLCGLMSEAKKLIDQGSCDA